MGAWGTAIFSNDTSRDVRDEYKYAIADGLSDEEATQKVLDQWGDYLDDPDEGPDIILGLVATQWNLGRLEDWVKERALHIIDTGVDVDRWRSLGASDKDIVKRSEVLRKLREQLTSPQPAPKKVRKDYFPPIYADLQSGDAISYRLDSGKYIILRVVEVEVSHGVPYPSFELCDWVGDCIPSPETIANLPAAITKTSASYPRSEVFYMCVPRKRDFPADRVQIAARKIKQYQKMIRTIGWGATWPNIESAITKKYGRAPEELGSGLNAWFRHLWRRLK